MKANFVSEHSKDVALSGAGFTTMFLNAKKHGRGHKRRISSTMLEYNVDHQGNKEEEYVNIFGQCNFKQKKRRAVEKKVESKEQEKKSCRDSFYEQSDNLDMLSRGSTLSISTNASSSYDSINNFTKSYQNNSPLQVEVDSLEIFCEEVLCFEEMSCLNRKANDDEEYDNAIAIASKKPDNGVVLEKDFEQYDELIDEDTI